MAHPLYVLAQAFDATVASANYSGDFSSEMEAALADKNYDQAVSCYAAQFAVLTQACQLGWHQVHEEPQTSALFGLLAGAFWHASILTETHAASDEDVQLDLKQWVYQDKGEEASFGYDFGIVAVGPYGMKKITLFQAKRPSNQRRHNLLDTTHAVEAKRRKKIPYRFIDFQSELDILNKKIDDTSLSKEAKGKIVAEIAFIKAARENNTNQNITMRQRDALTWVIDNIKSGCNPEALTELLQADENKAKVSDLLEAGDHRLFTADYSYDQVEAFLATALRGWLTFTAGYGDVPNWCHYVQWVNGGAGFPWSIPIDQAIRAGNERIDNPSQFSDVLARALCFGDDTIGWYVTAKECEEVGSLIRDQHPEIVWAVTADTAEAARKLLLSLGVPRDQIRPALRESSQQTRGITAEAKADAVLKHKR